MPWLFGRDWAAGPEPFPRLLRWALVAAPLFLVVALIVGWTVPYPASDALRIAFALLLAVSALCAFSAPAAILLLAFRPQYRNRANLVLTLIAAIPFALAMFVGLLWAALAITGGSLH